MSAGDVTQQIKEMLGAGIQQSAIASCLAVDPSYISQLLNDDEFRNEVQAMQVTALKGHTDRDKKLEKLEDKAIEKLDQLIDFVTKPMEAARMLSIINNTKRRGAEINANGATAGAPIVNLILPEAARVKFTFNEASQIVDVDGRSMAPLPSVRVQELLLERRKQAVAPADADAANAIYKRIGGETLVHQLPAPTVPNVLGASE